MYAPPASTVESLHLPPLWYGLLACSPAPSPCTLPLKHAVQLQSVESVRVGFVHAAADARRGNATTVPTAGDESLHLPLLHHHVILGTVNQHTSFTVPIESFHSALNLKDVSTCFCTCTYLAFVQCVSARTLLVHSISVCVFSIWTESSCSFAAFEATCTNGFAGLKTAFAIVACTFVDVEVPVLAWRR